MKKYALIGLGSAGSKIVDSFNEDIEKIAIDSDEECLNNLKNSKTIKVSIEEKDENYKLNKENKDKILNLKNEYDIICFMIGAGGKTGTTCITELANYLNDSHFIITTIPPIYEGKNRKLKSQKLIDFLKSKNKHFLILNFYELYKRIIWGFPYNSTDRKHGQFPVDYSFAEIFSIYTILSHKAIEIFFKLLKINSNMDDIKVTLDKKFNTDYNKLLFDYKEDIVRAYDTLKTRQ